MSDDLINKFTTHLKSVLTKALCFVVKNNEDAILPEHLLLALATQKGSLGSELLKNVNLSGMAIRKFLHAQEQESVEKKSSSCPNKTPTLSPEARRMLEKAVLTATLYEHRYVGTEHLLSGILQIESPSIQKVFQEYQVNKISLQEQLQFVFKSTSKFPELTEPLEEKLEHQSPTTLPSTFKKKTPALDFFGKDLTDPEEQKKLDPVIGRNQELERVMEILCRRTKNNPLLLGEPGVGKTALVEGLAKRIYEGKVPAMLTNKRLISLDISGIVAGTIYRGEFENRLKQIIEEIQENPDILLFIDEIHMIVGAGAASGSLDAAQILKPALARGEIHCIGATTPEEFKKHIEPDAALERRLQTIWLKEPSEQETLLILQGLQKNYETFHGVHILPETLETAVRLAKRYLPEKQFPDKAIDLIDEAAASLHVHAKTPSSIQQSQDILRALKELETKKRQAVAEERFPEAMHFKEEQEMLEKKLETLQEIPLPSVGVLEPKHIGHVISRMKQVPLPELLQKEQKRLRDFEHFLKKDVMGQEEILSLVAKAIRRAKTGIAHPERPLASFLFVGPSGTGKTELAKSIAKHLSPEHQNLIRFDMSEFGESFSVSKLLGSPAGYVGYRETAKLTDQLKQKPHAVILFDEIEKAHRDVQNLLLQMLEEGQITDATGKTIHVKEQVIILTSNIGQERFTQASVGFSQEKEKNKKNLQADIRKDIEDILRPELINRLDHLCVFLPLSPIHLKQIAKKQLNELGERLKTQGVTLDYEQSVVQYLMKHSCAHPSGARHIRHLLQTEIEPLIADTLLADKKPSHCSIGYTQNHLFISST